MAEIHNLIRQVGVEEAKSLARSADERRMIDLAAAAMASEDTSFGVSYAGFCQTSFPHRDLGDTTKKWVRTHGRLTLMIEPGTILMNGRTPKEFGVPYGSKARLILLYLQSRAIQTNSRYIELGRSMHDWMRRLAIPTGGKNYVAVQEQAYRLSACRLTIGFQNEDGVSGFKQESITSGMCLTTAGDPNQPTLWQDYTELTESFFQALKEFPVPISEAAIRALANQSTALDIYIWLSYRLRKVTRPTPITYAALRDQFSPEYSRLRDFKKRFLGSLSDALAVYPEANVDITDDHLILRPSAPAVPERRVFQVGAVGR